MLKILLLLMISTTYLFSLNNIGLNVNNENLELGLQVDLGQLNDEIEPNTVFLGFEYLHTDRGSSVLKTDDYYALSFLTKRKFKHNFNLGLGMKLNRVNHFVTIPLGVEGKYIIDADVPVSIGANFYYAPRVLSINDAQNYMEYRFMVDVEIIKNAIITVGYRSMYTKYEKPIVKNTDYNDSFYIGFKFLF